MPATLLLTGPARLDARGFAFGELTARRLRERPELLDAARAMLARWRLTGSPGIQATFAEWQAILDAGLEETAAVLTGADERSVRLRQSAPFAGEAFITRAERNAILREFAP